MFRLLLLSMGTVSVAAAAQTSSVEAAPQTVAPASTPAAEAEPTTQPPVVMTEEAPPVVAPRKPRTDLVAVGALGVMGVTIVIQVVDFLVQLQGANLFGQVFAVPFVIISAVPVLGSGVTSLLFLGSSNSSAAQTSFGIRSLVYFGVQVAAGVVALVSVLTNKAPAASPRVALVPLDGGGLLTASLQF
ncbi:MAG: hypothetical protein Q8S33_21160 [Myxococcales bacterium]|nr:hypothetical protein [Myxococcales bacterium]